ncbi:hypothetical protein O3M35_007932 [Rhynocoris fuscipes]|uniref:Uncharacterized protein n=1 Tax=Rhynocoris fuscipes TaxID=488301 RepID=A0AAW1DIF6_9HEMI
MQLKTGLLLSLASTQCGKCPTPVLALGECASIMSAAARLSVRSLFATSSLWTPPAGIVCLDEESAWLEAGPLLLPSYGVLYIGNLPKFGSKFLSQITAAVDSELVTLQQKPGSCSVDPKILTYPLKSAVWTHWKCNQYVWQDMHQLRTLIDVFGMPFISEIGCDDETISSCVIQNATGQTCYERQRIIPENDFREFLGIISSEQVEMSEEASSLIRNYFVASRRERPDSLPIKAVKVLTAMCESHARLSFRNMATYEDAVASIFLYEESVVTLFGKSLILEAPRRCCNSNNSYELAKQMDSTLASFSDWLESYIATVNCSGLLQ